MGQSILYVNEFDTSKLGLNVTEAKGWPDGKRALARTEPVPGVEASLILPDESETAPRTINIRGTIGPLAVPTLRTNLTELKDRFYARDLELRLIDRPDRFIVGRCTGFELSSIGAQMAGRGMGVEIALLCADPTAYDLQPRSVSFSSALKGALELGTARSAPVIAVMGAVNDPVVTLYDFRGVTVATMGFTVNLGANDYLVIDCELKQITKYAAGVSSDGIALLTSGNFFTLKPEHASYLASAWPTIGVSGGTGVSFHRRGWN